MNIQPSDETAPYIYAVMTDSEYDDFYPDNLYDYFYGRYENSGYEGTFAQYIEDYFYLVAAGVTIEGDDVTFYSPAESDYYEMW